MRQRITLLYIDSGGGHRAAATALRDVIEAQGRPWDVRMVCIQDILDSVDFIQKATGMRFQDVYNTMLRRGWTGGSSPLIRLMHSIVKLTHRSQVESFRTHWMRGKPDLVVSLIPHFNRAIKAALDDVWPDVPYVTLLTDMADYPPHFWMEPPAGATNDGFVICGSERAALQAENMGIGADRIFQTSGMILDKRFHTQLVSDRGARLSLLGLRPGVPTGLVLFGGEGSEEMAVIAEAIDRAAVPVQLILICGRNERLAARLRNMKVRTAMFVEGFTREIPVYMELADFFVGKPGPGSISEAIAKNLPLIVARNAFTMAHERYNAEWVEQQGVGLVIENFPREIAVAVRTLTDEANYPGFRQRAASIQNSAVFEIPEILQRLLNARVKCPEAELTAV